MRGHRPARGIRRPGGSSAKQLAQGAGGRRQHPAGRPAPPGAAGTLQAAAEPIFDHDLRAGRADRHAAAPAAAQSQGGYRSEVGAPAMAVLHGGPKPRLEGLPAPCIMNHAPFVHCMHHAQTDRRRRRRGRRPGGRSRESARPDPARGGTPAPGERDTGKGDQKATTTNTTGKMLCMYGGLNSYFVFFGLL